MNNKGEFNITWIEIVGIIIVLAFVFFLIVQEYKQDKIDCNNKYGVDNWELKEITSEGEFKFYIGQVWKCVKKGKNYTIETVIVKPGYSANVY